MTARIAVVLCCLAALPLPAQEPVTWTTGTYQYDGSGNIKFIDGRPYRYDELGRLTRAQVDATHAETFTYDDFGNILTIQKDGQAAVTLGVSQATNRITDTTANAHAQYNADGSISSTVTGDTFAYDGLGMVTESKVAGTRRLYLYSASEERIATVRIQSNNTAGTREWTIRNPSGAVLTRFTQTAAGTWSWDQDYIYANGRLVAAKVSGPEKVRHFFPDHLGTPRVITGNGGMELSRHTYYAYGEEVTSTASTERLKFTGHERDDPTLDYMHARYYAPMWGRFLSVDPVQNDRIGQPQAWNRYAYALNSPVLRIDPDGRKDTIYWLQSFNYREAKAVGGVVQAAVANRNYSVNVTYFASKSDVLSTLARAEETDIVIVQSHASRSGMRESGFFGPKALMTGAEMAKAVSSDASRPDAVILAGCATDRDAQTLAKDGGVPAIGTTSGVGIGVGTTATGVMIWSMLGGATAEEAAQNGNQHLDLNPVHCEPYPCDGDYKAFDPPSSENKQ